jgi:hypothetical protein
MIKSLQEANEEFPKYKAKVYTATKEAVKKYILY